MATAILSDKNKNLISALVFPTQYAKCLSRMEPGKAVNVKLASTKDHAVFIDEVE